MFGIKSNLQINSLMYSLIIKDCLSDDQILNCLILFFKEYKVSISPFDADENKQDGILFEKQLIKGDFCIQLFLFTKIALEIEKLAKFICQTLKTEILISDNDPNPFSWILITEKDKRLVYQRIDEDDEGLFLIAEES